MSIYNKNYKHLFIHNPKCAGSSMERYHFIRGTGHNSLYYYIKRYPEIKHVFKWGFVRNPYDRILSRYFSSKEPNITKYRTFRDYILNLEANLLENYDDPTAFDDWLENHDKYHVELKKDFITMPSYFFLGGANGIKINFVGKVKNIHDDWKYVCKKIEEYSGKNVYTNLRILNKSSNSKEKRKLITKDLKYIIDKVYDIDFITYDYKKEL